MKRLAIALSVAAVVASALMPAGAWAKAKGGSTEPQFAPLNLPNPLAERQANYKAQAQEAVLAGEANATGKNKVVKVGKHKYVELAFEGEDQILTVLGQFGNTIHPVTMGTPGPVRNQIPQPDRSVDNTTIWAPDFNKAYYENLLYNKSQVPSMAHWYLTQSSGKYSVNGAVGDWVQVNYNEARYGTNLCGSNVCSTVWAFVNDSTDIWWNDLVAQTGSAANANAYLAQFDVWDRYDLDGDGNFNEPDGYIDHFQSVHAGVGEETGGGAQGADAIWSHRWYAYYTATGPDGVGPHGAGGVRIGGSNFWIGDYTIEPENGGVGVFAHEFGHDLGLPDEYDTSGNTGGAENSTGWWTNWSQGSYGTIDNEGLGMYPVSMTSWERFQLGFINNYAVGFAGEKAEFKLGPSEYNTKKPQALFVVLPDKVVTTDIGDPNTGSSFYYSNADNDLDTSMTKSVTLPAGAVSLSAQVRYNIESDWDYAYVTVNGTEVATNLSTNTNPNSQNFGEGITGTTNGSWVTLTADLSAYAGQTVTLGFRYWMDGAQIGDPSDTTSAPGIAIDDIDVTGQATDGAEGTDPAAWTYDPADGSGFHASTGTESFSYFNAYVVESRTYQSYDEALLKGPYNFTTDTMVEHFPYQDGVMIWYWDESVHDNNVGDHPGSGWILPVDAHPAVNVWSDDGSQMRPRINAYDSSFTTKKTDKITLHNPATGEATTIGGLKHVDVFNDGLRDLDGTSIYWAPSDPSDAPGTSRYQAEWNSVDVPDTGTVIKVQGLSGQGDVTIKLNK